MEEERIIEMMKRIDDFISGKLDPVQEDALWIEFLKDPHWFNMFQTELHLTHLAKHAKKDFNHILLNP